MFALQIRNGYGALEKEKDLSGSYACQSCVLQRYFNNTLCHQSCKVQILAWFHPLRPE